LVRKPTFAKDAVNRPELVAKQYSFEEKRHAIWFKLVLPELSITQDLSDA
jgi:hypothetical protein